MLHELDLQQTWPQPDKPKPIVSVGAGGIVRDAHLPAYNKAGFHVAGVFDPDVDRAKSLITDWEIPRHFSSLDETVSHFGTDVVYDLAIPPSAIAETLQTLPISGSVLIQKPMGSSIHEARSILEIAHDRKLKAAVNFQLRFSPMMLAACDLVNRGLMGELLEIDVQVNIYTPWHMFPFLIGMDRVELSLHSIHYLDLIRSLVGNPNQVFCRTMDDPRSKEYAQTRTSAILDYGDRLRVSMNVNHNHQGGGKFQVAQFRLEGTEGSMFIKLGVLYDYPHGEPDEVWFCPNGGDWQSLELAGTWFPDAFIGTMSNLQRFALEQDATLVSPVDDAFETMALVEACYTANELPGVPLDMT